MSKANQILTSVISVFLSMALMAFTGVVLWFIIPGGTGYQGGRFGGVRPGDQLFLGITRETWVDIHDWGAIALAVIIVFHVALHWRYIWRQVKRLPAIRFA